MVKQRGLGEQGIKSFINGLDGPISLSDGLVEAALKDISPNPYQPRGAIKTKDLKPLVDSIKSVGVLEPLIVRQTETGAYELIAGERRFKAALAAGLKNVPVIIKDVEPAAQLEIALIENLLREDLNPIDQAKAYKQLVTQFDRKQADIAKMSGQDRSTVANTLRLLELPKPVQIDVSEGRLSAGHARALLPLKNEADILEAREQVLIGSFSVRETEALVKKMLAPSRKKKPENLEDTAYYNSLAVEIGRRVGSKVALNRRGKKGRIEIHYTSSEELESLLKYFGVGPV